MVKGERERVSEREQQERESERERERGRQRVRERARSRNDIETMTAGVGERGWQACRLACWLAGWMVGWQAGSLPDKETGWRAGRGGERSGGAESAGEGVLGSARAERSPSVSSPEMSWTKMQLPKRSQVKTEL